MTENGDGKNEKDEIVDKITGIKWYTAEWYAIVCPYGAENFKKADENEDSILEALIGFKDLFIVFLGIPGPFDDKWIRDGRGNYICRAMNDYFVKVGYPYRLRPVPKQGVYFWRDSEAVKELVFFRSKQEIAAHILSLKEYQKFSTTNLQPEDKQHLIRQMTSLQTKLYEYQGRIQNTKLPLVWQELLLSRVRVALKRLDKALHDTHYLESHHLDDE